MPNFSPAISLLSDLFLDLNPFVTGLTVRGTQLLDGLVNTLEWFSFHPEIILLTVVS